MIFSIQILGSNSALAAHGRHPTAQVVHFRKEIFLIDCGEGTQMRMSHFHVKRSRIRHIFISHLHGDHYFGLIGLLTSYHLTGRTDPLTVYAPGELEGIVERQLAASNTTLRYELTFRATQTEEKELLVESDAVRVFSFPLKHRIPTTGFLFEERNNKRRIDKASVAGLELQPEQYHDLRSGKGVVTADGRSFENEALTLPPYGSRSYAYCSDTAYYPELEHTIKGVDLIYHEATFLREDARKAKETFHSTTEDAVRIAELVGARHLLIGHFSSKYTDLSVYRDECIGAFPKTFLAIEGSSFQINRDGSLEIVGRT